MKILLLERKGKGKGKEEGRVSLWAVKRKKIDPLHICLLIQVYNRGVFSSILDFLRGKTFPILLGKLLHLFKPSFRKNAKSVEPSPPPSLPPRKEPTFSCRACLGPLVEEISTRCGHIFCKSCIETAIAAQGKCPTCRRKITFKDTIRIYLPTTN
ncbi:E3 ubiquitin-protein ligase TRIM21 [Camellia lanceoleosa]|uniref:E3 ubiquitin-protein ligase TRIM21 n=1 Tax=Camellia lanceoleosa TaxID=1840588 RepID=A0ACC0F7L6_9ERIC|nr:E3 ubiquitin-protein ligase TRIM21 [Camellia lanceoleosa]